MDVITSHINADFDAFSSMIAAKKLYPDALLVFPGSQEKNLREYLSHSKADLNDSVVKLKNISPDKIRRLIIVDTRQLSRIGTFAKLINKPDVEVIIYDHHPPSQDDIHGNKEYLIELGSNTTLMIHILKEKGILPTPEEATVMAMGIYEDTGSLLFPSTRPDDCAALGDLIGWGANLSVVSRAIYRELTPEQVDILDQLIKNAYTLVINGINILLTKSVTATYVEDFAMLVHKLRDMHNPDALFALGLMGDRVYMVARSRVPQVNVAETTSHFGGGGHPTAAAASIKDITLEQTEEHLTKILNKETKPSISARDIMTFPVKTIDVASTINQANSLLNRYNINAIPVASGPKIVGLITRQIATRAQGHELGGVCVKDYMITEIKMVGPNAPVWEIRRLVVDGNQRLLPVVEEEKLVGVITRKDLMGVMHQKMARIEGIPSTSSHKKSIKGIMKERLPEEIYTLLEKAGEIATAMGFNIYLVGGIIRDMISRIDNLDVDLVVEGDGVKFAKEFAASIGARVATHEKFKTAVITLKDGRRIDIATARLEYYKYPGGMPIVEESTLKLDLYRRDFTINTMAVSLKPTQFGQLIDYFGAQRDIKERRIRVLHSLSLVEDPSRILRAVRFEQRLGFSLGKQTLSLIHSAIQSDLIKNVPGGRIFHELKQILLEDDPIKGLERLKTIGVLASIHPEFDYTPKTKETLVQVKEIISWFALLYTQDVVSSWFIYLLALITRMKPETVPSVCEWLGITPSETKALVHAKNNVLNILKEFAKRGEKRPSQVTNILEGASLEEILFAMAKTKSAEVRKMISSYVTTWRHYTPPITGKDLIALGFREDKTLGNCLNLIKEKGLNGEIKDSSEAIHLAKKFLSRA